MLSPYEENHNVQEAHDTIYEMNLYTLDLGLKVPKIIVYGADNKPQVP